MAGGAACLPESGLTVGRRERRSVTVGPMPGDASLGDAITGHATTVETVPDDAVTGEVVPDGTRPTADPAPVFDDLVAVLDPARRRRSAKWAAHAPDVLALTVAELDVALAPPVQQALMAALASSDTGYAWPGTELGAAFAGFAGRRLGWSVDPGAVSAVPDVGVGVVELLRAVGATGRPVAFSPPVYPPFWRWIAEVGGRALEVPLTGEDCRLDLPALDRAFAAHRPVAYVLCSPHNPVGRVHEEAELAELVALATRHGVVLLADEIHAPLTLPGQRFTPLLTVPGAADVAVALVSASKAFNLAGLKCAAVVSAGPVMAAVVARMAGDVRWRVGHLGVLASVAAFTGGDTWLDGLLAGLDQRFDELDTLLAAHLPTVRWQRPQATYLAWLDCRALPTDAVQRFADRGRVAVSPGTDFGADGHVRLAVGTGADVLAAAVTRMAAALG